MSIQRTVVRRPGAFIAGVLLGLSVVTPVFAATMAMPLPPRDLMLLGSLVLLAVALAIRLMRRRQGGAHPQPDAPDMRWWVHP